MSTASNRPTADARSRPRAELARALGLCDAGISVDIDSNIPLGKGCASSTADIMASVAALVEATHPHVPNEIVHALGSLVGREIEWGDYVFSDSIALCLQRSHTLVQEYATGMGWRIVGVDEGGSVDTAAFHRRHRESGARPSITTRCSTRWTPPCGPPTTPRRGRSPPRAR